ncbi:1-acyl-sn-glycerol-3-phosphate acyltransferase [Bacillus aquiflavi]|uniref:1-acyl-sn-glycerol-3-phosphate acyltransferase n=1 Tax=Bacillus aquiflavi TaxID=2672567 RepID=A0A6B3W4A8_9BACI|nr:1-acyl-sn-glycerol-3-phosphate acyltransferase [Bacillus aquiflavi]MBA4536918.1 1-acyl-sn-glycerol-3-phosphate acyltransferase [Bacillus aquiflavi]NEY82304.1 1-acyl-sn-glycerol-3-phosphate acyltransferase [Bacillus aquiflavi]UAC47733.1 1-acyl-sn-glycerol-3-phosphate acyltransferase [Bacillus aquiflavi]
MYHLISTILYRLVKLFRLLKVEGKNYVPTNDKYVVACTHRGWVDVVMLALAVYPTQVHFMAKKELFNSKLVDKFLRSINAFPVNRENPGSSTLKIPLKLLKEGKCVGIFPSGTRTSEEVPLKRGAVTIALKGQVPLVPASYSGPTKLSDIFKGKKATIIFGPPIKGNDELKKAELIDAALIELNKTMEELQKKIEKSDEKIDVE